MKALVMGRAVLAAFACAVLTIAQVLPQTASNELITNAGWECVQGARVADGKLVIISPEGFAPLNDSTLRWSQPARDIAAREFNLLWGADAFGFRVIHPERDQYLFCGTDQLVAFAEANNMRVTGGSGGLLWGQNPPWLADGTFSRDEIIPIMREFIQTVVGRYRGRVHIWNVVNEIFEYNNTGRLAKGDQQIWMRIIGPEYIDMAFRWAHEADPQAILVLNEVGDEGTKCAVHCGPGNPNGSRNVKADALYAFVKGMRARGVPINAVGMQTHWGANMGWPTADPSSVAAQMKRLADLGLDVYITEMDVPIQKPVTPAKLAAQAETYRQMMSVCLAAANCKGFNVFVTDDSNWSEPPSLARNSSILQGQLAAPLRSASRSPQIAHSLLLLSIAIALTLGAQSSTLRSWAYKMAILEEDFYAPAFRLHHYLCFRGAGRVRCRPRQNCQWGSRIHHSAQGRRAQLQRPPVRAASYR